MTAQDTKNKSILSIYNIFILCEAIVLIINYAFSLKLKYNLVKSFKRLKIIFNWISKLLKYKIFFYFGQMSQLYRAENKN